MSRVFCVLATLTVLGTLAGPALGATEDEKAAQAAFDEAMKLMRKRRYTEACASFERSQKLDPGMGTQFRLAECYEKLGRTASAYEQYLEVAEAAKDAKRKNRERFARRRAETLEKQVARLTIDVAPAVASLKGIEVRRDGIVVDKQQWGEGVPVDPGDHVVTVRASERVPFERKLWADAAAKIVVSVAGLEAIKRPKPKPKPRSMVPVFALGGAGVVGVGLGITFVALRASKASNAQALHDTIANGGGNCRPDGPPEFTTQCVSLLDATSAGDTYGTVSVVSFVIGGAALAAGAVYFFWPQAKAEPEPDAAFRIVPMWGPGLGGVAASGVF